MQKPPARLGGPQIWRLQKLLDWLRREDMLTSRLAADEFEVSRRTIASDIEMLRQLGVPVEYDPSRFTYYLSEPFENLPLNILTSADLAALLVARHALEALGDGPDAVLLAEVADRLAAHLPEELVDGGTNATEHIHIDTGARGRLVDGHLERIRNATSNQQLLTIRYYSASRDVEEKRIVEPLSVLHRENSWYLIAWCRLRNGYRDFRIDRIRSLRLEEEIFARRKDFDIESYLADAFGMHRGERRYAVRIRFSPYQSRWIREKVWHESELKLQRPDGGIDLLLHTAGLTDLARWVMQYGAEAEVISPPVLRRRVATEVRRMAELYADTPALHSEEG